MSKKVNNIPSPEVLMNSMRSIGYNFKTALADIIDNSISAHAKKVFITLPINNKKIFVSILDDGDGMTDKELLSAMKYGSDNKYYGSNDLGRFGLGLKSASLSQCRVLTVASKRSNSVYAYQWDLDEVIQTKEWTCLKLDENEVKKIPTIDLLLKQKQGTLVVWENFDIAEKKSKGLVREYLSNEMFEAEKHLRLIFHRFLSNKFTPLKIYINNNLLIPIDPFLESHPKTDSKEPSELDIDGSKIKVQPFILPYQNDLDDDDIEKLGGIESFKNGQGFYIYRNERLIVYGTWFRLSKSNISNELFKYGRIKVDIPNTLDDTWEIDIKKQNATIPKQILNNLKKVVSNVCTKSISKTAKRTKLTTEKDDTKIWNKILSRDNKDSFYINTDCDYVKNFIDDFDDKDKSRIIRFLDVISASIPSDDIYTSICNKNIETKLSNEYIDTMIVEGVSQFKRIKQITHQPDEKIFEKMEKVEPYNNLDIISKIKERILNEKN